MIIQMPGNPLGHVGQAVAATMQGEAQFRGQLARVHQQNKALEQRDAYAKARLLEGRQKEAERRARDYATGMGRVMKIAAESGLDTTFDGYRHMRESVADWNPDALAQVDRLHGLPQSDGEGSYPGSYTSVAQLTERMQFEQAENQKGELLQGFMTESSIAGYDELEVAEIQALASQPDTSPDELAAAVVEVQESKRKQITKAKALDMARSKADALANDKPEVFQDFDHGEEAQDLYARIVTGQSANPQYDLMRFSMLAMGHGAAMKEMQAQAYMEGKIHALSQQQAQGLPAPDGGIMPGASGAPSRGDLGANMEGVKDAPTATDQGVEDAPTVTGKEEPLFNDGTVVREDARPNLYRALTGEPQGSGAAVDVAEFARKQGIDADDDETLRRAIQLFILDRDARAARFGTSTLR